jgi:ketosteroid isomerase-like protein
LLAEELSYTHSSGKTDTKAELLASVSSGKLKYESIEPSDTKVRVYGSTAVITGQANLKINNNGQPLSFAMKFTGVYAKRDGRWQLVAYQSTRLAP